MKIMQLGCMGRDVAAAEKLMEHGHQVYPAGEYLNPSLVRAAEESGGEFYHINDVRDGKDLAGIVAEADVDLFYTNSDEALAAGVVDKVAEQNPGVLIASPDKEASQIEWDKEYAREVVDRIDRKYNPLYVPAKNEEELNEAIEIFLETEKELVVKPLGLTGGKGVKVMGPHLDNFEDARKYAKKVLKDPNQEGVILEEKIDGQEFTVQAYTDGRTLVIPPVTYDYPYREDGDEGPGTGGMGCFTMPGGKRLPFLTAYELTEAKQVMSKVLEQLEADKKEFKGTLYGSFFKTEDGLKVVEFNARIGDPEGISIVDLLEDDVDLADILEKIAIGDLEEKDIRFRKLASTVIYLVSPDYAYKKGDTEEFFINDEVLADYDCRLRHAASEEVGAGFYRTVGTSRSLAVTALADTPWEARATILDAIDEGIEGPLQYREDIGSKNYIDSLA